MVCSTRMPLTKLKAYPPPHDRSFGIRTAELVAVSLEENRTTGIQLVLW